MVHYVDIDKIKNPKPIRCPLCEAGVPLTRTVVVDEDKLRLAVASEISDDPSRRTR